MPSRESIMPDVPRLTALCWIALCALLCLPTAAQDDIDAIPQPEPRPAPAEVLVEAGLRLELYFSAIAQGSVGLLRLEGDGIRAARLSFLNREQDFFPIAGDGWYAFALAEMDAPPRSRQLTVQVESSSGSVDFQHELRVEPAGYITQDFNISGSRSWLADPGVERAEFAKLDAISAQRSPLPLWDALGFALPLDAPRSSPFGAYRVLNEAMQTRHTGWDQRAAIGTPVQAIAAGKVAFAGLLDIRGDYVMIDHGYGVYSGYAHFSQRHVTRGQDIAAGQIIGMSGNSGRSSGPHLHWEMTVDGEWVDGMDFIEMWLPAP